MKHLISIRGLRAKGGSVQPNLRGAVGVGVRTGGLACSAAASRPPSKLNPGGVRSLSYPPLPYPPYHRKLPNFQAPRSSHHANGFLNQPRVEKWGACARLGCVQRGGAYNLIWEVRASLAACRSARGQPNWRGAYSIGVRRPVSAGFCWFLLFSAFCRLLLGSAGCCWPRSC